MMINNYTNSTAAKTTETSLHESSYAFGYVEPGSADSYYQSYFYQQDRQAGGVKNEPVPQAVPIEDGFYASSEHESEDSWYTLGEMQPSREALSGHSVNKHRHHHHPAAQTKSIAMPASHIPRTYSEIKLSEDTQAAEWRDYCMYRRFQAKLVQQSCPCRPDQINNLNRGALAKLEERHHQDLSNAHVVSDCNTSHSCSTSPSEMDDEDVFAMDM